MILVAMVGFFLCEPAVADKVSLRAGGSVVGETREKASQVWVKMADEVVLVVPKARVKSIQFEKDLEDYRKYMAMAGNDPDRHYKLYEWCAKRGMLEQKRFQLQRTIALDPNHEDARKRLEYTRVDGEWIKRETLQRRRGLVNVGGTRWMPPELIAREKAADEADKSSKLWVPKLKRMIKSLHTPPRGVTKAEAWQALKDINDPMAAKALAGQLEASRAGTHDFRLRELWVRLLGKCKNKVATRALVKAGIDDPDSRIRNLSLEQLSEYGRSSAVASYRKVLVDAAAKKHPDSDQLRRAAIALQSFPDPEMAMVYVDALVTEHIEVGPAGPAMSFGFGNNGSNGMSTGGQPDVKVETSENGEVRNLLKMIEPDADFGFNEEAWRRYFASKRSGYRGDLRRDL
ncbi:MAG: HEAT repeat domain-containing protein [Planctomycetota bacterium]